MFHAKHQNHIDAYLNNEINSSELKIKIKYNKTWGFPFQYYLPIIRFAKKNGIKILGINSTQNGTNNLLNRDIFAADIICRARKNNPEHKIFALIGEHHLSKSHLPKQINQHSLHKKNDLLVRVLANIQKYSQYNKDQQDPSNTYSQPSQDLFHIHSCPIWIKWHSLIQWQEKIELKHSSEELVTELEYLFYNLSNSICDHLNIKIDRSQLESFKIAHTNIDSDFSRLNPDYDENLFKTRITTDGYFYDEKTSTIYVKNYNINYFLDAIGQNIFCKLFKIDQIQYTSEEYFYFNCLKIYFGKAISLLLNPHNKNKPYFSKPHYRQKTIEVREKTSKQFLKFNKNNIRKDLISYQNYSHSFIDILIFNNTNMHIFQSLKYCYTQQNNNNFKDIFINAISPLIFDEKAA